MVCLKMIDHSNTGNSQLQENMSYAKIKTKGYLKVYIKGCPNVINQ